VGGPGTLIEKADANTRREHARGLRRLHQHPRLAAHAKGTIETTTTVEVLQEFAHVRARRRTREDAVNLTRLYAVALNPIVTTTADLDAGLALFEQHPALGAFDAVLAAVALARGAEALVSADGAFASVPGLAWIDPATPAIDGLLGGSD